jgi:hypothetical protein
MAMLNNILREHYVTIIEDQYLVDRKQNKNHRKKRINKKWGKKYGFSTAPKKDCFVVGGGMMVCHPTVAKEIRASMKER